MLYSEPVAQGHRRSSQGIQRVSELIRPGLGGQGIGVECHNGLDARCPQLAGRTPGAADPATHGRAGNGQLPRNEPVPSPSSGRDQGLADQVGGVGAARQQAELRAYRRRYQPQLLCLVTDVPDPARTEGRTSPNRAAAAISRSSVWAYSAVTRMSRSASTGASGLEVGLATPIRTEEVSRCLIICRMCTYDS